MRYEVRSYGPPGGEGLAGGANTGGGAILVRLAFIRTLGGAFGGDPGKFLE